MALVMSLKGHRDCCGFVKWGALKSKKTVVCSIFILRRKRLKFIAAIKKLQLELPSFK